MSDDTPKASFEVVNDFRIGHHIRSAILMILNNRRKKYPKRKFLFHDLLRYAILEFIGSHPEYHDPTFDFERLLKQCNRNYPSDLLKLHNPPKQKTDRRVYFCDLLQEAVQEAVQDAVVDLVDHHPELYDGFDCEAKESVE